MEVPTISVDKPVDVIALLSGHDDLTGSKKRDFLITKHAGEQVPVESLRGKYLLICCFLIPVENDCYGAATCRAVIAFISKLPEKYRKDFRVVVVPKIRTALCPLVHPVFLRWFYSFFLSAFPDNCLIIPPWDSYSCDYVCKTLDLSTLQGEEALLLDPDQMVVQHGRHELFSALEKYGAAGFPFTKSQMKFLDIKDEILKLRLDSIYKEHNRASLESRLCADLDKLSSARVSLEELLEHDSLSNIEDEQKVVPVSYFRDKLVGLYIYYDGEFMSDLGKVLKECDEKGYSFEIVLIRLSALNDPSSVLKHVILKLEEHEISTSNWWTFPFNYNVCHKLWRMCDFDEADKLIIVPPPGDKNRSGDLQGKAVIRDFDGFRSYPFTREPILERKLSALSSVTLESLLKEYDHLVCKEDVNCSTTVADLRGKHIILYFDDFDFKYRPLRMYDKIRSQYSKIKAEYPDFEVVFAPISGASCTLEGEAVSKMPWPRLPFYSRCVREQLLLNGISCCVAFGKDGRVRSTKAHCRLMKVATLFEDHLRKEIVEELYLLNKDSY